MCQILPQQPVPREPARLSPSPIVIVPTRRTSLRKASLSSASSNDREEDPARKIWASMRQVSTIMTRGGARAAAPANAAVAADARNKENIVPACWTYPSSLSARTAGGIADGAIHGNSSPANSQNGRDKKTREAVERRREFLRDQALRNRRSVGADTLRSLVPTVSSLSLNGSGSGGGGGNYAEGSDLERSSGMMRTGKAKKDGSGRWGWGGWW